jgi:hypothetical protein
MRFGKFFKNNILICVIKMSVFCNNECNGLKVDNV